ncbi:hypothetical protein BDF20DRAFT_255001 [Mycotypha africana]|uniref:uncharacterized protein n=1 Tax=Mycotypha africana TaxID=64632 RepID=UPI002300D217|nr:uncharacterized protein BDF20DRAFT_255001 [Mycotypha africana]KAI8987275.1 hypothetical protein BDF20DRAFT_255001 [Mycotypha africana]
MQEEFSSLPSSLIREVVNLFCYQEIVGGEPSWPASIHLTEEVKSNIIAFCQPWKQRMGKRINLTTLSVNPGCFVPFLFLINDELEKEHAAHKSYDVRRLPLPRLFSVLPTASIRWRFVTVSVSALSCFTRQKLSRGYQDQLELFYRIFRFQSLRYRNLSSFIPNGSNTVRFGNIMRTDGFSIDFLFYKRRHGTLESTYKTLDLSLDDFSKSKVEQTYVPIFVDSNRKSVFNATVGIQD